MLSSHSAHTWLQVDIHTLLYTPNTHVQLYIACYPAPINSCTQIWKCTHKHSTHTQAHKVHTYTHSLPIAHAFVQGKMCLAGKELFSVNSYNSSSQTWVLGWAATIPLWPANYCETTYESSHFIICKHWYTGANSCLIAACSIMLCSTTLRLKGIPRSGILVKYCK